MINRTLSVALAAKNALTFLGLRRNDFGPSEAMDIAHSLHQNSVLRTLDLEGNFLSDDGVAALCEVSISSFAFFICFKITADRGYAGVLVFWKE